MAHYAREEIMSSSDVARNFGAVLSSVVQHRREKVAIIRNNRLEAVLVAADVYESMEKNYDTLSVDSAAAQHNDVAENSTSLLDFLTKNRLEAAVRLLPEEIERQIREEREAWD
jgi:PHD/YefM family antitoxin component YafN of YafNO toxin-antitoxin module